MPKTKRSLENAGISDNAYFAIMQRVANDNYKNWELPNSDAALVHALNDNTYNYRGYYNKYPNGKGNAIDHWTDEFKTVYHPTFSKESKYSGKKSQYNPKGITGGTWYGEYFLPSVDQYVERSKFKNGGDKQKLIDAAKRQNARERTIAKHYLAAGPNISNLAKAAYHWYKSVPALGGQAETGNIYITGEAPTPGLKNPKAIINKTNEIKSLIPRYNNFAKFYGYDAVPNGADIKQAEQIIRQGLKQHNTFYRGLTVPKDKSSINKALEKQVTDEEALEYMAKRGSKNPNNTYFSPDERAAQYTKNGKVAVVTRKYSLGENPQTWLDDADFIYDTTSATSMAPKGYVNYPWAGKAIEKVAPGEVRINPEDYNF